METTGKETRETIVEVTDNGPLKITGNIYLKDIKRGTIETVSEVNICRCRRSNNKPYCDGTHCK